jgi:hypothetical protein
MRAEQKYGGEEVDDPAFRQTVRQRPHKIRKNWQRFSIPFASQSSHEKRFWRIKLLKRVLC